MTLVSIMLSSLDSLLNAGAVVFTQDILRRFANVPDRIALRRRAARAILVAGLAAAGDRFVPSIIKGLLICYRIWAPAILPAVVFGLWCRGRVPGPGHCP